MSSPVVVYISPNAEPCPEFHKLATKIAFQAKRLGCLRELFTELSDPNSKIDLIIFDLPGLYSINGASIFEIINMVSTMSRSSISASSPVLSVLIEEKSCPKMIKGVLGTDIKGFVPKGDWLGPDEAEIAIRNLLVGKTHIPKKVLQKVKPVKKTVEKDGIRLTARQEQVLKLICNRGLSNKAIASILKISESTVKLHISAILKEYGVRNRTQLALAAGKHLNK
jgi:DNA-binding NarL/FixJ family response regulator